MMELLVILVGHLHLKFVLQGLGSMFLIGCIVMILEMTLYLIIWWRGLKTMNVLRVCKSNTFFTDHWSSITLL